MGGWGVSRVRRVECGAVLLPVSSVAVSAVFVCFRHPGTRGRLVAVSPVASSRPHFPYVSSMRRTVSRASPPPAVATRPCRLPSLPISGPSGVATPPAVASHSPVPRTFFSLPLRPPSGAGCRFLFLCARFRSSRCSRRAVLPLSFPSPLGPILVLYDRLER
jgi:hypothetical protein